MRPRKLQMTAFGPYPGVETVDFDALAAQEVFVISGPTGAGKTTIFDAMCVALYGGLAGVRQAAGTERIRSDFADPAVPTSVSLAFDAGRHHWRVTRTPKQERPRKRGTGTTVDAGTALLERLEGDAWVAVETKVSEVNKRVAALVGLDAAQFQQVVLLPQGQFQRFLDASSADRRPLLAGMFGSAFFEQIEREVDERAKQARNEVADSERCINLYLTQAHASLDAAERSLTAAGVAIDPIVTPETDGLEPTLEQRCDSVAARVESLGGGPLGELRSRRDRVAEMAKGAQLAAAEGARVVEQINSRDAARAKLEQLERQAADIDAVARQVDLARRVAPAVSSIRQADGLEAECAAAVEHVATVERALRDAADSAGVEVPPEITREAVAELVHAANDILAAAQRAADDLARAKQLDEQAARHQQTQAAAAQAQAEAEARRAALHTKLDEQRAVALRERTIADDTSEAHAESQRAAAVSAAARRLDQARSDLDQLEATRNDTERRLADLDRQLEVQRAALQEATNQVGVLDQQHEAVARCVNNLERRHTLDRLTTELAAQQQEVVRAEGRLRAATAGFIATAAPRLAATLRTGEACPVCGSIEHPAPAEIEHTTAVSIEELETARRQMADAQEAAATTSGMISGLADVAGLPTAELEAAHRAAIAAVDAAERAARDADRLTAEVARLELQQAGVQTRLVELAADAARIQERHDRASLDLGDRVGRSVAELAEAADQAAQRVVRCEAAAAAAAEATAAIEALDKQCRAVDTELPALRAAVVAAASSLTAATDEATRLRAAVAATFPDAAPEAVTARGKQLSAAVTEYDHAVRRHHDIDVRHRRALEEVDTALSAIALTRDHALAVALDGDAIAALDEQVQAHRQDLSAARAVLDSLADASLPDIAPDLTVLQEAVGRADAQVEQARDAVAEVEGHLRHAAEHLERVRAERRAGAAKLADSDLWHRLDRICRGGENRARSSLESWVLAAHLAEVFVAANVHLATMTHGRFQLVLGDDSASNTRDRGLNIVIEDAAAGARRLPQMLSGGERFKTALALAMGLADVVANRSGSAAIEALFIDEGFGTLDAESQAQAVEVLRSLPQQGLMVGVITHVESVKDALGVGIEVVRRADGGSELVQIGVGA